MIAHLDIMPNCINCDNCLMICPENCIVKNQQEYLINHWQCSLCLLCIDVCPDQAIKLVEIDEEQ